MAVKNAQDADRGPGRYAEASGSTRRPGAVGMFAIAAFLALTASFANFLVHNTYPLWSAESGIVVLGLAGVAGACSLLYAAGGKIPRLVIELLLVYVALDLNVANVYVPAIGTVAAAIVLNRHIVPVLSIISGVVLAFAVAGINPDSWAGSPDTSARPQPAGPAASGDRPVLVHLILDEHIGVEGLPADMPSAVDMKENLKSFYRAHGFRLYGRAHSEFMHTVNSLSDTFNFGTYSEQNGDLKDGIALDANGYFDHLAMNGYRIRVYQSDFIDYCVHGSVADCTTRRAADMAPVAESGLSTGARAELLAYSFADLSDFAAKAGLIYNIAVVFLDRAGVALPWFDPFRRSPSSLGALDLADDFLSDLRAANPGDAFIVHLLLPHYPHVARSDCSVKPVAEWRKRWIRNEPAAPAYDAYFDQIGCVLRKMEAMLDVIDGQTGRKSIVMVHGDHGSRMTAVDPKDEHIGRFSDRDLINTFSTLFAVRAPGIEPAYDDEPRSLAGLFTSFVQTDFREISGDAGTEADGAVVLENEAWIPVTPHSMPADWR